MPDNNTNVPGGRAFRVTENAGKQNVAEPSGVPLPPPGNPVPPAPSHGSSRAGAGFNPDLDSLKAPAPLKIDFNDYIGEKPQAPSTTAPSSPLPARENEFRPQSEARRAAEEPKAAERQNRDTAEPRRSEPRRAPQSRAHQPQKKRRPSAKRPARQSEEPETRGFQSPQTVTKAARAEAERKSAAQKGRKRKKQSVQPQPRQKVLHSPSGSVSSGRIGSTATEEAAPPERSRRRNHEKRRNKERERSNQKFFSNRDKSSDERRRIRQTEQRRRRTIMTVIISSAAILLTFLIAAGVYFIGIAVVKECSVVNSEKATYSDSEIIVESQVAVGKSRLLFVSGKKLSRTVAGKLPYVKNITIEKNWPNSLTLKVNETEDMFCFVNEDKQIWLDENGKVLNETKKKLSAGQIKVKGFSFEDQPYAVGSFFDANKENSGRYSTFRKIAQGVKESGLNIRQIEFLSDDSICLTYNKYVKIYGNKNNDYAGKLKGVKELLAELGEIDADAYFDITQKEKIAFNYGTLK